MWTRKAGFGLGIMGMALAAIPASAQSVEEFYASKPLRVVIGYSPGGGYDLYARLLSRFIGKYLPGAPEVITENLPGAGSVTLANQIFNVLPADGSVIGAVSRAIPVEPLLGINPTQYEAREFSWIGSMTDEVSVCVASRRSGVESWENVVNGDQEIILGGTGAASDNEVFARMQAELLDANIRIISGYPGSSEVTLAMEQGEIDGFCGSWSSFQSTRSEMLASGEIKVMVVLSTEAVEDEDLSEYPLIMDFAETEEQRQVLELVLSRLAISRPFLAPPNVPEDRLAALRTAFIEAIDDPDFQAEAQRLELEMNPMEGQAVADLINEIYDTPQEVLDNTRRILAVQ